MIDKAKQSHLHVDVEEFIKTEHLHRPDLQESIKALSRQPLTAVFTSMNAVEAVAAILEGKQPSWQIFALGTAIKKIAADKLNSTSIYGGGENAGALAEAIIAAGDVKSVVFFCGDKRRDELPQKLKAYQIDVKEFVVYNTTQLKHRVSKHYDGIMFFSPSAVESFFAANRPPQSTILFAIGDTTAGSIEQYSSNKVITSDQPGKQALLEKVISHFNTINQQR
jgi:uroporphyrinogen-III synthase